MLIKDADDAKEFSNPASISKGIPKDTHSQEFEMITNETQNIFGILTASETSRRALKIWTRSEFRQTKKTKNLH